MSKPIRLSIIIVNYNVEQFLALCLDAVNNAIKSIDAEIIVVDNASDDGSVAMIKKNFPEVKLIESKTNLGFSKANNIAFNKAEGKYIHFLNPDTVLSENYYDILLPFMEDREDIGAVGPRIIDGKGQYAVDSKKAFPSFWVSVAKVLGLSNLFPHSSFFNKYYAAHIGEFETAEVDILSGCSLLIKKEVILKSGGPFDEDYFMYCEDVDLCYRIQQAGFKNYYVPQVNMIHYKGESTKKLTYSYLKVFYKAHAHFVRKYYPKNLGMIYNLALKSILGLRHVFNFGKVIFSVIKLFIIDVILLSFTFIITMNFWFEKVAQITPVSLNEYSPLLPLFLSIWLISLYLNGAYDKPYSMYKAGRGMLLGGILVLAAYSLLPESIRFSRGTILLSTVFGTLVILITRWLLGKLKWIKLVPRGKLDYSLAVVCAEKQFPNLQAIILEQGYQSHLIGFIGTEDQESKDAAWLGQKNSVASITTMFHLDEVIFDSGSQSYDAIMNQMQQLHSIQYFNILLPKQKYLIGSHNHEHPLNVFNLHQKYPLGQKEHLRSKRILDLFITLSTLLLSPIIVWRFSNKKQLFQNIWNVFQGRYTWIGYPETTLQPKLPTLKPAILVPFPLDHYHNGGEINLDLLYQLYAETYAPLDDLKYWWQNFKYLDRTPF